tara:strand:+ start:86 stop:508 length:423 start_codon:yes stop_codon:yes gene_type:complete
MKRLLLIFIPLMFFFGCENEEEDVDNCFFLYGNWNIDYATEGTSIGCFCGYNEDACTEILDDCLTFDFLEDGSYVAMRIEDGSSYEELGSWSSDCSDGNSIVLTPTNTNNSIVTLVIQTISNNNLELVGYGEIMSLTRIE